MPIVAQLPARGQVYHLTLHDIAVGDGTLAGNSERVGRSKRTVGGERIHQFQRQITQRNHLPEGVQRLAIESQIATAEQFASRILAHPIGINGQLGRS
ncbi:hypothetical protein D3C73_1546590 [compost metagenome]